MRPTCGWSATSTSTARPLLRRRGRGDAEGAGQPRPGPNRLKRGGGRNRVDLDRLTGPAVATDDDLLELDDALDRLAKEYPSRPNW